MNGDSTPAPEGATTLTTKPDLLNIEHAYGDVSTLIVFVEALEGFILDLQRNDFDATSEAAARPDLLRIDTMAFEIKTRLSHLKNYVGDFIDAAAPAQLWAERKDA